jgi:cyclopropane fatty-acyl-phospholipid synthase-like methyltransferase
MIYRQIGAYYDLLFPLNPLIVTFLADYIDPNDTVLDIGCGTGSLTHELSKTSMDITGIDPSEEMIRIGKEKYPHLTLSTQEISQLKKLFDLIYSVGNTVSYFSKRDLSALVKNVTNRLKPGGTWIYQTVNWDFLEQAQRYDFPDKQIGTIIFKRKYVFKGTVETDFHLTIKDSGETVVHETHRLYRLLHREHLNIHQALDLELRDCFLSWSHAAWYPHQNGATIMVFRKKSIV